MGWNVTMLFIHFVAFFCAISLYRGAPCCLQKVSVGVLAVSFLIYVAALAARLWADEAGLPMLLKRIALTMEHFGVLVYVFRVAYREHVECKNSSPQLSR